MGGSVQCLTLDFSSGHDLGVLGLSPALGFPLSRVFLSLSAHSPAHALSFSNKSLKTNYHSEYTLASLGFGLLLLLLLPLLQLLLLLL